MIFPPNVSGASFAKGWFFNPRHNKGTAMTLFVSDQPDVLPPPLEFRSRYVALPVIRGIGGYLPDTLLTNAELAKQYGLTEEWITSRTGIEERRILAPGENTSDLGVRAARRAIADSGIAPEEITHLILGSCAPDGLVPNTSTIVQRKLGLSRLISLDYNVACSGFLWGLYLSSAILTLEPKSKVLLVTAEGMSRMAKGSGAGVRILFGDGAGSAVITSSGEGFSIKDIYISSDGTHGETLTAFGGGSRAGYGSPDDRVGDDYFLKMDGGKVFKHAVLLMTEAVEIITERNGLTLDDFDLFIPHQANMRIIESVAEKVGLPREKLVMTLQKSGNTSAASIPLAIKSAREQGLMKRGQRILLASFGAGFTWGSAIIET